MLSGILAVSFSGCIYKLFEVPEHERSIEETIVVEGRGRSELFTDVLEWIELSVESTEDPVLSADRDEATISAKGYVYIAFFSWPQRTWYTVNAEVSDGRIDVTLTDFYYEDERMDEPVELIDVTTKTELRHVQKEMDKLLENLRFNLISGK